MLIQAPPEPPGRRHRLCYPLQQALPAGWQQKGQAHTEVVRITVRVRPGSARPGVGGAHDGALVVRVSERAVDGRATAAALAALAAAFGVRRHAVTLVAGASSRTKIVDVAGADQAVLDRLLGL
jgi:uncharacterized protein YggU (UPF0235/DUF167 family)